MDIKLQAFSPSFVAAAGRRYGAAPGGGPAPRRPRVLLVCGLARVGAAAAADISRTLRLVDLARSVFDAAGVESTVLDLSRLRACQGCVSAATPLCPHPGGRCPNQAPGAAAADVPAAWPAADGALILLPAHWRRMSSVLRMMIDRGMEPVSDSAPPGDEAGRWGLLPGPCRTYGLVVHGDLPRSLQVRRALCDWLDWMGLLDACEQARLDHFLGLGEPAPVSGMPPEGEAALEDETRAAARALVHAITELQAGRLASGSALLARAWPR
jgi:hypothetical protein